MKIYKEALGDYAIEALRVDYDESIFKECWRLSEFTWPAGLYDGNAGIVSCRMVSDELKKTVIENLQELLPPANKYIAQFYNWHRLSGIAPHTDKDYVFGATLYLTPQWEITWGGNFNWCDKHTAQMHTLIPEFNTLVVNDEKEVHWVNPVSPTSPHARVTLQIWGKND